MPYTSPRPCRHPGCPSLVGGTPGTPGDKGGGYCQQHARQLRQAEDAERGTASQRGYGATWRRLRTMFLAAHPLCADPFGVHEGRPVAATDVDHIVMRRNGGTDDESNLQPLCHACHSRKTSAEVGRG